MRANSKGSVAQTQAFVETWQYLESRPHPWKRELFVKGQRVRAGVIYSSMIANHRTQRETARAWNLPLEVIEEVVRYCEANWPLISRENERERESAERSGTSLEPPVAAR